MSQRRLPAEIYWRRRLLLLAVVIALVWVVLQVTGEEPDQAPSAATVPAAAPTVAAPPVSPAVQVDGAVDVALTSARTACDPEKVRVTPTVKGGQLTKRPVDVGLVISSTETQACTLQPDDAETIAVISANGTPVWDSTVCKASLLTTPVELSPEWATLVSVQWTGRGSGSNCTSNEGYATPGTYTVQIGTLGGEPGQTSFKLAARPAPPKKTPTPTKAPASPATPAPTPTQTPTAGSDVPAPLPTR